jgi:hypothetical protein
VVGASRGRGAGAGRVVSPGTGDRSGRESAWGGRAVPSPFSRPRLTVILGNGTPVISIMRAVTRAHSLTTHLFT